jgi:molybdenum cofactor cytidylyltransferase
VRVGPNFGQAEGVSTLPVVPNDTVALVLAAGLGTRFQGPTHKLCADLRGRRVIDWVLDAVLGAGFHRIIVVQGAIDLAITHPQITVISNPHADQGQATSLQAGITAARDLGANAVVVGLGDQPFVGAEAWHRVALSTAPIGIAVYPATPESGSETQRGNPVRLGHEVWDLLPSSGDFGARHLISRRPELVEEVPCQGSPSDIDTLEDLRTWNSTTASP